MCTSQPVAHAGHQGTDINSGHIQEQSPHQRVEPASPDPTSLRNMSNYPSSTFASQRKDIIDHTPWPRQIGTNIKSYQEKFCASRIDFQGDTGVCATPLSYRTEVVNASEQTCKECHNVTRCGNVKRIMSIHYTVDVESKARCFM